MKSKRLDIGAAVVILACLLGFCHDLVFNGEVPFYRDLTNYFYPLRYSLSDSLRVTDLGVWNRQFAQGFPNLASFQTGVFYLPHWTFLLLPFYATIRVLFVFHFLVAASGSYILLRRWHYSHDLAIVGALLVNYGKTWFTGAFPEIWLFLLGGLFVVSTLFLPRGVVGLLDRRRQAQAAPPSAAGASG